MRKRANGYSLYLKRSKGFWIFVWRQRHQLGPSVIFIGGSYDFEGMWLIILYLSYFKISRHSHLLVPVAQVYDYDRNIGFS